MKKYGANAPQLRPIRCSIDFYVMLCNEQAKKQKNTAQTRHNCAISGRKPPQEPCASTSSPSPSKMERGLGGEARDNCDNRYKFV